MLDWGICPREAGPQQASGWAVQENRKETRLWPIEWGSICCSSVRSPTPSHAQPFQIKWDVYFSKELCRSSLLCRRYDSACICRCICIMCLYSWSWSWWWLYNNIPFFLSFFLSFHLSTLSSFFHTLFPIYIPHNMLVVFFLLYLISYLCLGLFPAIFLYLSSAIFCIFHFLFTRTFFRFCLKYLFHNISFAILSSSITILSLISFFHLPFVSFFREEIFHSLFLFFLLFDVFLLT